jgi:hypothetical protein
MRIQVLVSNRSGVEFKRGIGFADYALAMERRVP